MIHSVTYNIAKFLASILNPLTGSPKHHIHNTLLFLGKVRDVVMEADESMILYNVTSLFTRVTVTEALEVVCKRLQDDPNISNRNNITNKNRRRLLNVLYSLITDFLCIVMIFVFPF